MKTKIFKAILLIVICLATNVSFAQNIYTVGGTGVSGFSGDGGLAIQAKIKLGRGIAVDGSGNIYIADDSDNRIRKISSTGIMSTIAGTGTAGYSGDGGAATSATLRGPSGVAIDGSGNIYIADQVNNVIRKINSSGTISTFAGTGTIGYSGDGGAATSATMWYPLGVAVDGSGNVYIADTQNDVIRKVNTSGNISTVAGNGTAGYSGDGGAATSAKLNSPTGIEVDGSGNLYIADNSNNRIRKVNTSGTISTIAGTGTASYTGDGGAATSATINQPWQAIVDGSGNIYISDSQNNCIRKINTSGTISTVAGTGTASYSGDGGAATSATMNYPQGIDINSSGYYYICDNNNYRIRAVGTACTANAGVDKNHTQNPSTCAWPGVQIGTSSIGGMTYGWLPTTALSSSSIAQPTSSTTTTRTYTVTVSGSCITASDAMTVTAVVTCQDGRFANSNESPDDKLNVLIYPNPTNGKINIETKEDIESIFITDITGRIVFNKKHIYLNTYTIDFSKEAKGMYLLHILQNGKENIVRISIE